jgi:antitoxin component YwqK of YwqJK toxin-antitoxin module
MVSADLVNQEDGNGLKTGWWEEYYKGGELMSRKQYDAGRQHGECLNYYLNGNVRAAGKLLNGKMSGEWRFFRESGALWQIGNFVEDIKNGPWIIYQKNGEIYDEGQFVNGKKTGEWKFYDEVGKLIKSKVYR